MKKVAIIGSNGQLGSDLVKVFKTKEDKFKLYPLTRNDVDIRFDLVWNFLNNISPDILINTAAYHKVDEAEEYPYRAFEVNSTATKNLAEYCKKRNVKLVFISTDYVFGMKGFKEPYVESDLVTPLNAYGVSKAAGEMFIQYIKPEYLIVRTSGLFGIAGSSGKVGNFVEKMIGLAREKKEVKVVDDQELSPTYTRNLAEQIVYLLEKNRSGLYHAVSEGSCTWYEFTKKIFELMNIKTKLTPVSSKEFPTKAERPKYSVLSNDKLNVLGINLMERWEVALKFYLKEKGHI